MKLPIIIIVLLTANIANAQDIKRFIFGVNAGGKFANRNYAERYAGAHNEQLPIFFSNPDTYQRVRQLLGNQDFQFFDYSDLYRYQAAPVYGVNVGFQASRNLSFEADLNFSNLRMLGGYTLEVNDPTNFTSQPRFENGNISGRESRFNGRINVMYTTDGEKVKGVFGLSGILNSWRMEENIVELNGTILTNLFSQFNANNGFNAKVRGTGFGYGVNMGVEIPFKEGIVMQIVYQPYVTRMDYFTPNDVITALGDSYVRPDMRLEHDIIARFIWR